MITIETIKLNDGNITVLGANSAMKLILGGAVQDSIINRLFQTVDNFLTCTECGEKSARLATIPSYPGKFCRDCANNIYRADPRVAPEPDWDLYVKELGC